MTTLTTSVMPASAAFAKVVWSSFHPLQHVVAVVKFLSHMPKQVSFGQGM